MGTIENVPDDVRARLAAEAERTGESVSEVLARLVRSLTVPGGDTPSKG